MKTLEKYYEQLRDLKLVQEAEAVDITAAAKWYFASPGFKGAYWDDFPCPMPPFPTTWMEYQGSEWGTDEDGTRFVLSRTQWSCFALMACTRVRDTNMDVIISEDEFCNSSCVAIMDKFLRADSAELYQEIVSNERPENSEAAWILSMQIGATGLPVQQPRGIGMGPYFMASLDCFGNLIPNSMRMKPNTSARIEQFEDGEFDLAIYMARAFLFALSLMNAKNVSLVDAPALPPKVLKRREREGKPALKFKVLQIDPMRARVKREAKPGDNEVKVALHLCRGHFKDYRESGGLFGKYKGLYWWDSQVRGTDESGRIIKDYALNAPHDAAL